MTNLKAVLYLRTRTQAWLARELGVSDAAISRYVRGERHPDRPTLRRIARLLACEVEELTGETEIMTDDERRALEAFRQIPEEKRQAFWTIVDALRSSKAHPSPNNLSTSGPSEASSPSYRPGKKSP